MQILRDFFFLFLNNFSGQNTGVFGSCFRTLAVILFQIVFVLFFTLVEQDIQESIANCWLVNFSLTGKHKTCTRLETYITFEWKIKVWTERSRRNLTSSKRKAPSNRSQSKNIHIYFVLFSRLIFDHNQKPSKFLKCPTGSDKFSFSLYGPTHFVNYCSWEIFTD